METISNQNPRPAHKEPVYCPEDSSIASRLGSFIFYQWCKAGFGWGVMGTIVIGILFANGEISTSTALAGWIACAYTFHEFEEFVIPGGFLEDFTKNFLKLEGIDRILDERAVFLVNIPLIWIGLPTIALLTAFVDPAWLSAAAFFSILAGLAHIIPIIKSGFRRWYNPGLAMSLLLNIPLGVAGVLTSWDITSKINNGSLFTMWVFWFTFIQWGLFVGRRYKRTRDPHYRRQWIELMGVYTLVGIGAWLFYMVV